MRMNTQAEQAIIGDILLEPSKVMPEAVLQLSPDDFHTVEFRTIFEKCLVLYREDKPIDSVTVLDIVGSEYKETILTAAAAVPSISNYREYIKIVHETAQCSRAAGKALELIDLINSGTSLEECREKAAEALQCFNSAAMDHAVTARDGLLQFFETKEQPKEYIETGFSKIDSQTFIERGDYAIIGGRPSTGKTAITLQIAMHMAQKWKVVYFSLETKPEKLFDRMIACYTGTSLTDIKRSDISDNGWVNIVEYSNSFSELNFSAISAAGWTVEQIKAKAMQLRADVIFIDYLGLIGGQGKDLYERTTRISTDLHVMAQQTGITVIALSQMNRRGAGSPDMTSLRDSGAIEQDADCIFLLVNPDDKEKGYRDLIVCKNKEGRCGAIHFSFDGLHQIFYVIDEQHSGDD